MENLPIAILPDPVLHAPTRNVSIFDDKLTQLVEQMRETMHAAKGVGLAAPQISQSLKLAVLEYDPARFDEESDEELIPFMTIINPTITKFGDEWELMDEGCLSIPEESAPVPRATEVTVLAQDVTGERIKIRAKGFLARILQHEIDHLNGFLIVDRTTSKKIRKKYA